MVRELTVGRGITSFGWSDQPYLKTAAGIRRGFFSFEFTMEASPSPSGYTCVAGTAQTSSFSYSNDSEVATER